MPYEDPDVIYGDDADSAGLPLVAKTDPVPHSWNEHNRTRDLLVTQLAWSRITGKPSTFPPSAHTHDSLSGGGVGFASNSNIGGSAGFWSNARLGAASHAYFPGLSAATSSYTVAYINGDGRLSKGASSERFKKHISDIDPLGLGNLFPAFKRFKMRQGDDVWRYGYTAEEIAANPDTEPFCVYERDIQDDLTAPHLKRDSFGRPIPEAIDFIGLLLAQVAQLNARVIELEAKAND